MHRFLKSSVVIGVILMSYYVFAHDPTYMAALKFENSRIISWVPNSHDGSAKHISIFDAQGHSLVSLNVLRFMPEARGVSIYDVSARGNLIAVAAVCESREGNRQVRPTASLLLFDLGGKLLSAFAMAPSYQIGRLVLDEQSNIWTLTDHTDYNVDPSTVPMVVEYTNEGKIVRQLLSRKMFPYHALDTKENSVIGATTMGYQSGNLWFWLPGSTDFVTITTNDGKAVTMKTGLPRRAGRVEVPLSIYREPSGSVVGQFREDDDQRRPQVASDLAHYIWSPATGKWAEVERNVCEPGRLIGVDDKQQLYLRRKGESLDDTSICTFPVQ